MAYLSQSFGSSIALQQKVTLYSPMRLKTTFIAGLSVWLLGQSLNAASLPELFEERSRTLVFVEYYTQREIDRVEHAVDAFQ